MQLHAIGTTEALIDFAFNLNSNYNNYYFTKQTLAFIYYTNGNNVFTRFQGYFIYAILRATLRIVCTKYKYLNKIA